MESAGRREIKRELNIDVTFCTFVSYYKIKNRGAFLWLKSLEMNY